MEDTDPKSSASAPAAVQYMFLFFLLEVLPQFLVLVFSLDTLLQDAANVTLRSETLRETVCDAMIANGAV